VNSYSHVFGNQNVPRGVLTNGAPGAGKTFVLQAQGLYGMSMGLRVMSTSLMAVRSIALGGIHLHRLLKFEIGKSTDLFRLAEVRRISVINSQLYRINFTLKDSVGNLTYNSKLSLD